MISIIITAFKEPKTIGKAIESIEKQKLPEHETLVVAPDEETLHIARSMSNQYKKIKIIKDKGKGKPAALNLAVKKAKGGILILTDGDVYLESNSIKNLLEFFKDKKMGAVTGRPISLNSKKEKYGFWAFLLTEIAHQRRKKAYENKKRFFCSGYLFAIRKKLFPKLPEDLLSEDGYISHKVYESGYMIGYSPNSKVYVKYPNNFSDWIKQKKRSAGGYNQIKMRFGIEIRSFRKESMGGFQLIRYCSNIKEIVWLIELFVARIYLWLLIYRDINFNKKSHKELWQRVESTK